MGTESQIHWCEGLFLQPHHLQFMQKNMLDWIVNERRYRWAYPYGVVRMRLSEAELENQRLRFDELHVIMPNGLDVQVPGNADLPTISIQEALAASNGSLQVSLGTPLWQPAGKNVVDVDAGEDWRAKRLYRVAEMEKLDENTGDNPQVMRVRRINARLLFEHDDTSDLDVLPLLRVVRAAGEDVGLPRADPAYIPPCLSVNGSAKLRDFVRDLTSQILASRSQLVLQTTRGGFSMDHLRGVQFEQVLRLGTLNRWGALLECLSTTLGSVAPFEMYIYLRQLLAELAALRPDRDPFEVPPYNHHDLHTVFDELARRIRPLLQGAVAPKFLKVPFVPDEELGCLSATLTEEALSRPNEYYLAIKTKMDPKELALLVEDANKFKLMPRSLARQRIYGVKLAYEGYPPVELPAEIGLCYFRLARHESERMWERITQEKVLAATWPEGASSDFQLTLYMPVP